MSRQEENVADPRQKNIDRTVAFAVLRRLSNLVAAEISQERTNLLWAKRFFVVLGAISAVTLVIAVSRPGVLQALFRTVTGAIR